MRKLKSRIKKDEKWFTGSQTVVSRLLTGKRFRSAYTVCVCVCFWEYNRVCVYLLICICFLVSFCVCLWDQDLANQCCLGLAVRDIHQVFALIISVVIFTKWFRFAVWCVACVCVAALLVFFFALTFFFFLSFCFWLMRFQPTLSGQKKLLKQRTPWRLERKQQKKKMIARQRTPLIESLIIWSVIHHCDYINPNI